MSSFFEKTKHKKEFLFEQVFNDLYQTLCAFAFKFLKDELLAADVVQETFVKLWEHYPSLENDFNVKSYLYTAVRHQCINILRNKKEIIYELQLCENEEFYKDILIEKESYRIFYNAVDSLPPQTRKVIYLSIDGLKNAEIAELLNVSEANVHRLKKLAYKKLKIILKDYYYLIFIFVFPK
ncbi:MAG: sigma-70 family RNA polymerase sigma factor [Odoribacter sp.]